MAYESRITNEIYLQIMKMEQMSYLDEKIDGMW